MAVMRGVLALLAFGALALAQDVNPFGPYAGELERADPPDWMKEGSRIQWEIISSTIPQPGQAAPPTGAGIICADIVSLVGNTAAVSVSTHVKGQFLTGGEALGPATVNGTVVQAANGNGFWVHPVVLRKVFEKLGAGSGWTGVDGPYEFEGRKVPAYQFVTGGGAQDQSRVSLVYDKQTGILLFSVTSMRQNAQDTWHPITLLRFLKARTRKLPWAMGRPPSWLGRIAAYQFEGSVVAEIEGMPPTPIPMAASAVLEKVGTNFVTLKLKVENRMAGVPAAPGTPAVFVCGPTQVGGIWLPPLELGKLQQGTVCDRDEVMQSTTQVTYVGPTQYGRRVATIMEDSPGYAAFYDYELETGMLLISTVRNKLVGTSTQIVFTGKQRGQGR